MMHYRTAVEEDVTAILELYKAVSQHTGGLARYNFEITEEYVAEFVKKSLANGLIIVALNPDDPGEVIGEVHAYKSGLKVFEHVLSDLTVAVHPSHQGKKIGRTMFAIFLEEIGRNRTDIGKVELITRESNRRAIGLYESLGFKVEGRLEMRIKTPAGGYEADIPMGWQNPNFEF